MILTIKLASLLLVLLLASAACELGISVPTPAPDGVELSVLVEPAGKGYVELDGSLISPGVAVPVNHGKLVNLVAKPSGEGWQFARWERGLSSVNSEEALLMDSSKVVRAVFAPVNPAAAVLEPTPISIDPVVQPAPGPSTPPASRAPVQAPAPSTGAVEGPTPSPTPDITAEPPGPSAERTPAPSETEAPPPVASFELDLSSGSAPHTVQFNDASGGSITS